MTRAHFVKSARKDNTVAKKGYDLKAIVCYGFVGSTPCIRIVGKRPGRWGRVMENVCIGLHNHTLLELKHRANRIAYAVGAESMTEEEWQAKKYR